MRTFRTQFRISRWKLIWYFFSRHGAVLTLRITSDESFAATLDDKTPPRPKPRWRDSDEIWEER